jgi:hypothetical protein
LEFQEVAKIAANPCHDQIVETDIVETDRVHWDRIECSLGSEHEQRHSKRIYKNIIQQGNTDIIRALWQHTKLVEEHFEGVKPTQT